MTQVPETDAFGYAINTTLVHDVQRAARELAERCPDLLLAFIMAFKRGRDRASGAAQYAHARAVRAERSETLEVAHDASGRDTP